MRWRPVCVRWPRTLFVQLLLAVFVALAMAQLLGARLMLADRNHFVSQLRGEYMAQRLASIVLMLDRTPPSERSRLLGVINQPPSFLTLGEPWKKLAANSSADQQFRENYLRALGHPAEMQILPFELPPPPGLVPHHPRGGQPPASVVQTRLADGTVLTLRHAPAPDVRDWPGRTLALLWVLALVVVLLAGLVLRRLTRPLAALADAATGLARNLNQPPLAETGPVEIARAAAAFNAMQRDLRTLLDTRAQALAGVSHDLRLPITRLRLRLEKMTDPDLRQRIEVDLAEMDSMIGHTLDFLRAGNLSEPLVRLNLDALLETLVEDFEDMGSEVCLHGVIGQPVLARPQALRRCLSNLLENARRYAGGVIDLSVCLEPAGVEILVQDRGPGIPDADRERVFEPYFRLEASRAKATGGSGLGLAIARAIARAQGGDVSLSSRPGGGLSVRLFLPLGR